MTAAAFCAFRTAAVEVAVIEVGMGGRRDATNGLSPDVCVVTNVDYDHTDVLTETLEHIAMEKAGIVQQGVPVIVGFMAEGPRAIVLSHAACVGAPAVLLGHDYKVTDFARVAYRGICSLRVGRQAYRSIALDCPAPFMATNAAHALAAFDILCQRYPLPALTDGRVRRALESVHFPGRCEICPGRPTIVVDGAHAPMAAASLRPSCERYSRIGIVSSSWRRRRATRRYGGCSRVSRMPVYSA